MERGTAMRGLIVCAAAAMGATGCQQAEVTLSVDPGFYPSAVAHDPGLDRFFVGSYATGEVLAIGRDGSRSAALRPSGASAPVVQLAYERKQRRLWTLTPRAVEVIDLDQAPARRTIVANADAGGQFGDLVVDGADRAFVLDVARHEVLEVDAPRRSARVIARWPAAETSALAHEANTGPQCAGVPAAARDAGALMLLPDRSTLIAAADGSLWRIDRRSGDIEEIRLGSPLPHVSQLVLLGSDYAAYHVAALRGRANEVVTVHLAIDARRATVDAGTRIGFDTPLHGTFDGRRLVVLLGRLRHHPSWCGDGRPNLPAQLVSYAISAPADGVRVARVPAR